MEKEIWKDIEGYEGYYMVSNMGRVKSVERTARIGRGYRTVPERILKTCKTVKGYLYVYLYKDGKAKWYRIHRLVATAFCENPEGYTEVNHKDENKQNNCMENLEWCSRQYNNTYNGRAKKVAEKQSKPVIAIEKRTGLIVEFASTHEAERKLGIAHQNICACLRGRYKTSGGFYWMYANVNDAE